MRHCDRLNLRLGNEILDDELPPELGGPPYGVYFRAREILVPGGRC